MNERRYLIEILLRARESVTQVAQRAARAIDNVTKAQDDLGRSSQRMAPTLRQQISTLEQLVAAHTREKKALEDSSRALRTSANARRADADEARKHLEHLQKNARIERALSAEKEKRDIEEVTRIRLEVAEREAAEGKKNRAYNRETSRLRKEANLLKALAAENSASNKRRAAELDVEIAHGAQAVREQGRAATASERTAVVEERAHERVSRALGTHERQLDRLLERQGRLEPESNRFTRTLERMGLAAGGSSASLRGLSGEFRGLQLAIVIKYAQSLISVLAALAAQLFAVGAAAVQAGVGLSAALGAGLAQSIPVVAVLGAALARLTSVLKAVKQQNQQQLTATHDAQRAANAQRTATDQVRSAEERVQEAHRNTAQAIEDLSSTREDAARQEITTQREVNDARREAVRTVQDLIDAERQAVQTVEQAQSSLRRASSTGDVAGVAQGILDVSQARQGLTRAREDRARQPEVERVDEVIAAEQRLADVRRTNSRQIEQAERRIDDARRAETRASQDLARTHEQAAENVAQETAAADKLVDMLKQLSPAERQLYERILTLQGVYKRVARPITDILVRAFTDVVDITIAKLRDPRIIAAFRGVAEQVAGAIRRITREASGPESTDAFLILSREAQRNIPIVTRILSNFFGAVRNLIIAALPAFRLLLSYVEDYSEQAKDASGNSKGLTDFFVTGVRYANSFFKLMLSIIGLFLALAGRGGAAGEGIKTIDQLTGVVNHLTDQVDDNAGAIRNFFSQSRDVFFDLLTVIGAVGKAIVQTFSSESVHTFAQFLIGVIIPALADTVEILGFMVTVFHQIFSIPGVAQVAQFAATVLIMAKGLTVIRLAIVDLLQIIPTFLRAMGLMEAAGEGAAVGLAALTTAGLIVVAIVALAGAVYLLDKRFHFLAPTLEFVKRVAADVWEALLKGGKSVIDWFSDVWTQGLLYWIRWPFVKLYELVPWDTVFNAIMDAARALIDFFSGGQGGFLGGLRDVLIAPFKAFYAYAKIVFKGVQTLVKVFVDVLAGRWDDAGDAISDFWNDIVDVVAGGVTTLLGLIEKLLDALGKIPKIGGPFRAAAREVHGLRDDIDKYRESLRKHEEAQKKSNDAVKDSLPQLVNLRKRYDDAQDRVDKLKPGTDAYKDAVKRADKAHQKYNDALKDTAEKADGARPKVRTLRTNIERLGGVSGDTARIVAEQLNDVLRQLGAKVIRLNTKAYKHSGINEMTDVIGHGATGGVLSRSSGLRRRFWGGGIPNPYGGAGDDHVIYSPMGSPVAAISGTEGIVNRPQMGVIQGALEATSALGLQPYGGLNELWGSGMRHYVTGGNLAPGWNPLALARQIRRLGPYYQLGENRLLGDNPRPGVHSATGWHYRLGNSGAIDINADAAPQGEPAALDRLAQWLARQHYHYLWRVAGHYDHLHVDAAGGQGVVGAVLDRIRGARIGGGEGTALRRIAVAANRRLVTAANRYLARQQAAGGDTGAVAMRPDANVVSAFRRAMNVMRARPIERLAGFEAGIVESGLRNLYYGDRDSLGSLQERTSIFGRAHALNPYASMVRFLRDAISRRPWRGSAGSLAQAVQRSAFPSRYDAVRGQAMRYMQTGGPLGHTAAARPRVSTRAIPQWLRGSGGITSVVETINDQLGEITKTLRDVSRKQLTKTKGLALRIQRAFTTLTEDGGILDLLNEQIGKIATRAAVKLQQRQFTTGAGGPRRTTLTDADIAEADLQTLQQTGGALTAERGTLTSSLQRAQDAVKQARRQHNSKAEKIANAAVLNLRARLEQNTADLAQNAQDQVEAQENFQQALFDAVQDNATRQSSAIDRWQRVAKAMGIRFDPNAVLAQQVGVMQQQIAGLQGVLAQAERSGNVTLANQVRDQIAELQTTIAEAAAQAFQNSIDAVNNTAQRSLGALDRAARRAQIGTTNFDALGTTLTQRGGVLAQQRSWLATLLGQASAAGNVDQVENLIDQIDELDTQLAENTQAIRDNTDAAFNARTQNINDAFSFSQGVFGGVQGFFQALTQTAGVDTTQQQTTALQGVGTALATQQGGLKGQLAQLLGYTPTEAARLMTLTGADLVSFLSSISSGPAFDAIIARLDPTQQTAFKDLITSLIGNATATEQNTQALNELTGNNAQSFTSSLWSAFRIAVFTGAGGLLPQFASTVPSAAVGARIQSSGMLMAHAGERIVPAGVSRNWQGGDYIEEFNVNVTHPVERFDYDDLERQVAFERKHHSP